MVGEHFKKVRKQLARKCVVSWRGDKKNSEASQKNSFKEHRLKQRFYENFGFPLLVFLLVHLTSMIQFWKSGSSQSSLCQVGGSVQRYFGPAC